MTDIATISKYKLNQLVNELNIMLRIIRKLSFGKLKIQYDISLLFIIKSVLNTKSRIKVYDRDSVVTPDLDHLVHQLPLTVEGVELPDLFIASTIFPAA